VSHLAKRAWGAQRTLMAPLCVKTQSAMEF